jgi:formamidopyrimidine-DNA glycosylase
MPELPEVETIRRALARKITGQAILSVEIRKEKLLRGRPSREMKQGLEGRTITAVGRRAKFLLLRLDQNVLVVHLGMTGQVLLGCGPEESPVDKHVHMVLTLSDRTLIYFRDPRQFGRLLLLSPEQEKHFFADYGPEPLEPSFTGEAFYHSLHRRRAAIKAVLLNQKVIAGLGNIYVDESLFRAGIRPSRLSHHITHAQAEVLRRSIQAVLKEAVHFQGTSISDYCDPDSKPGRFQLRLNVYGREGEPCQVCGTPIRKAVLVQRGTHWCPKCQK